MKNCPLCTENIQDDAIFCHYCGRDIDSKISTEDHKKCPFCAENIKKEAIVCRYCQREIRTIDNGDNINKYEPKIREGTVELTLEDMDFLFESWGISYGKSSLEARKKISSVASNIHKGDMADVMGKFMKYKLANERDVINIGEYATSLAYQWAFLCFAIGLEDSFKNIENKKVPLYLDVCTKPFLRCLVSFLDILIEKSRFSEKKVNKLALNLYSYLLENSIYLENQGYIYHKETEPKYDSGELSPLAIELLRIVIEILKKQLNS